MKFLVQEENKAAFEHARLLTAYYSKSFYISARILPREKRWATYAIYGFCRYVDNLIDNPRHRSKAELKHEAECLGKEIQIAYRSGESEHPILKSFILVARHYQIPMEYPLDLIKGVVMDIQTTRYHTFEDLYLFAYRVAGVVGLMMTSVLGYRDRKAFYYAEKLGIAMQLTNILRDIKEDKNMDRIYLPLEELKQYKVTESDIFEERMTPEFLALMKFQVSRAHNYYREANAGIKLLPPESRFAIYSASKIYDGILHKIENRDFNPFLGRVFLSQSRKMAILVREVFKSRLETIQEIIFASPIHPANS